MPHAVQQKEQWAFDPCLIEKNLYVQTSIVNFLWLYFADGDSPSENGEDEDDDDDDDNVVDEDDDDDDDDDGL